MVTGSFFTGRFFSVPFSAQEEVSLTRVFFFCVFLKRDYEGAFPPRGTRGGCQIGFPHRGRPRKGCTWRPPLAGPWPSAPLGGARRALEADPRRCVHQSSLFRC